MLIRHETVIMKPNVNKIEFDLQLALLTLLLLATRYLSKTTPKTVVCFRKWRLFVDCINGYVSSKYNSEQKDRFNGAVETAVRNVFKMCKDPEYSEGQSAWKVGVSNLEPEKLAE